MPEIISSPNSPVTAIVKDHAISGLAVKSHESIHSISHPAHAGPILAKRSIFLVETSHPHTTVLRFEFEEVDATGAPTGLVIQPWHHTISDEAAAFLLTQHPDKDPYQQGAADVTQQLSNKLLHAKIAGPMKKGLSAQFVPLPPAEKAP